MTVKSLFSGMLLLAATTANAQYIHIRLADGTNYHIDSKTIESMIVDNEAPKTSNADGQIAGHDYVTIGGRKWATMNIGATAVAGSDVVTTPSSILSVNYNDTDEKVYSCFGTYFKWGETTATNGSDDFPTLNDCDNPKLCSKHDAATVIWGSKWRTPTTEDFQALSNACAGTTDYSVPTTLTAKIKEGGIYWLPATQRHEPDYTGVAGTLFVDKKDPSKRVFFPAAGGIYNNSFNQAGAWGFYWSSSLCETSTNCAYNIALREKGVDPVNGSHQRVNAFSVRPVSD